MDVNGLPIIGPGVDYNKVGAIHQKRTIAFINHFISNTVSFLNKFARSCEQRLEKFDARIQKVDASLSILEAKLSSISALENASAVGENCVNSAMTDVSVSHGETSDTAPETLQEELPPKSKAQDPRFAKFFKMVQVGVHIEAVRLKMKAEGLDPSILDDPNGTAVTSYETSKSDSESSFSE